MKNALLSLESTKTISLILRLAIGTSFLSAVADRFGFWGAPGTPGIAWGNFENFTAYTALLNPLAPSSFVPVLAWVATLAEILLGVLLILGFKTRVTALASGALLIIFALSMTFALGPKAPLDYSVWSASAACFALAFILRTKNA